MTIPSDPSADETIREGTRLLTASSESDSAPELHSTDVSQRDSDAILSPGHHSSLRSRLVLALAGIFVIFLGVDEMIRFTVITPEFLNLERTSAVRDTHRVMAALNAEIENLAHDASNIAQTTLKENQTSIWDTQFGENIHWTAYRDGNEPWRWDARHSSVTDASTSGQPTSELRNMIETLASDPTNQQISGMTSESEGRIYLFAGTRIPGGASRLDGDGQPGFYVIGRRLGDELINTLRRRTDVEFSLDHLHAARLATAEESEKGLQLDDTDDATLMVRAPLCNPNGEPLATLTVKLDREITQRSHHATSAARYLSICIVTAVLLIMLLLLQRLVIGRVAAIRQHTNRIAAEGLDVPALELEGSDEIGQLAQAFDRMKIHLGETQSRLAQASHAAGMNKVADTVIHNVGNVLTNVNSLIETASKRVSGLRIKPLDKLADRLTMAQDDPALAQATPAYLKRLSGELQNDQCELFALLNTLNENIQHIHQVIRDQRRHTTTKINRENVSIVSLLDEAIRCCESSFEKDEITISIINRIDAIVSTDRSQLLQILINIIGNARDAIRRVETLEPTLRIDLIQTVHSVHVRFHDNGCGMTPEILQRVFDAHFTTREGGTGLGLHYCAITIKRLGGEIRAESRGLGQGSTFTIEVPLAHPTGQPTRISPLNATKASLAGLVDQADASIKTCDETI
ncbi:sensor histidine kinase [Stieleria varia]|nr:ATP-binding protein [Stieleria varia]